MFFDFTNNGVDIYWGMNGDTNLKQQRNLDTPIIGSSQYFSRIDFHSSKLRDLEEDVVQTLINIWFF